MKQARSPKIGLLLIASPRFRHLGAATERGEYEARKEQEAARIEKEFAAAGDIVRAPTVYEREDVKRAICLFSEREVDCAAVMYLSWAEDFAWIRFLRDMPPLPVMLCSLVHDRLDVGDTEQEDNFVQFLSCGGLVGSLEASGSIPRLDRKMLEIALGSGAELAVRLKAFAVAAMLRSVLRQSTVGLLASYNEVMWSTYVDPYTVFAQIGPELRFISVAQLFKTSRDLPDKLVEERVASLKSRFSIKDNVDGEKLSASVRASMGLEKLAEAFMLDLLVLNDVDATLFEWMGLRPGFVPTSPDSGLCVVPEGDIGGGLAVYLLTLISGHMAQFIEPFYIDRERGLFQGGHAGPNNYWEHPENTVIARDERFAKTSYKYAGAPFAWHVFAPGRKTMLHMSQGRNGRMKMVVTLMDVLSGGHELVSYSHASFRHPTLSHEKLFERLLKIGVTQHYAIAEGEHLSVLKSLADMMDFDFHLID